MSVRKTLRRDLGSQFAISRNLRERWPTKLRRGFWAAVYLVKALRIGVKALWREQLGSRVVYGGQVHTISNWSGSSAPAISGPLGYRQNVPREQLTNVVDVPELWHRFEFGLSWYLGNWHEIDVSKRLYPDAFRRADL